MEKSVDLLVRDHQWVAWLSVVSLVSFTASVVTVAIVGETPAGMGWKSWLAA